jgi:phosphoribosylglycinamide formyltransferase-1
VSLSIAIFVSGRGSNMKAILDAKARGQLAADIAVVVSNNPDAPALEIAKQHGIATIAISHRGLTRDEHEEKLLAALAPLKIDFVVLAGYMRILTSKFLQAFRHADGYFRVINIHPSLLPAFPGAAGYDEAFAYGVRLSGITVHLVDEQVDHGPILAQECFPRFEDDTLETFKARGLELEHQLYPAVLQRIAQAGGVKLLMNHEAAATVAAASTQRS